jgi:outer membrane protein assembly factor BamB
VRLSLLGTKVFCSVNQRFVAPLLLCGLIIVSPPLSAEWPQWRGPHANGSVAGPARVAPLPEQLSMVWKRQVGGGYSGPVVSGDRVWVHSRQGSSEVVSCLALSTGDPVWSHSYSAPYRQDEDALSHGLGPYATPALKEGRLFTFGVNSVLIAWEAASGKLLWRRDSADEFDPSSPFFGAAASPIVSEGLVFVHLGGHERSHIENPSQGAMVALHVADGREVWRWTGDGPAVGATPVIAEIGGEAQLVFKTKKMMVGAEARTGRELWRIPYVVSQDNTIVTPLFAEGRLITSDFDRGVEAWEIRARGSYWTVKQVWKTRSVSMSMSSPVVAGGLLVGFSHMQRGQLFLLDPKSGDVRWQGSGRSGEHASLIAWGDEAMVFGDSGSLVIGMVEDRGFRQLQQYKLGRSVAWSHPAVVGSRLIYRDGDDLVVRLLE